MPIGMSAEVAVKTSISGRIGEAGDVFGDLLVPLPSRVELG